MLEETKTPNITIMCGNTVFAVQLLKPRTQHIILSFIVFPYWIYFMTDTKIKTSSPLEKWQPFLRIVKAQIWRVWTWVSYVGWQTTKEIFKSID